MPHPETDIHEQLMLADIADVTEGDLALLDHVEAMYNHGGEAEDVQLALLPETRAGTTIDPDYADGMAEAVMGRLMIDKGGQFEADLSEDGRDGTTRTVWSYEDGKEHRYYVTTTRQVGEGDDVSITAHASAARPEHSSDRRAA